MDDDDDDDDDMMMMMTTMMMMRLGLRLTKATRPREVKNPIMYNIVVLVSF